MLTEFVAKPFRKAVDLIAEARAAMIIFGNVQARSKGSPTDADAPLVPQGLPQEAEKRLQKAEETFREIGARMQAFASTDAAATALLHALGADMHAAGLAFIGLSNSIGVYGKQRADASVRAEQALRLRTGNVPGQ
jgi:hypothetical protein